MQKSIVIVVGTRPDALKLVPIYLALQQQRIPTILCATNQHKELLADVFSTFDIIPDVSLDVMRENQTLDYLTATILQKITDFFVAVSPSMVIVQGDTTTSFAAALAAFYLKIPVSYVEAGLRTGNMYAPFPEEMNRSFISKISTLHFAPTPVSVLNLLKDGIPASTIFCVGNTIVDALMLMKNKIESAQSPVDRQLKTLVELCTQEKKRMVLLTTHRRESFDGGIANILQAVAYSAQKYQDLFFFFPMHPNPHVRQTIEESGIGNLSNVICLPPLAYHNLVFLLSSVEWVMTDSGGIQEEAVSLGKRVLILRDSTERIEAIWDNMSILVGTQQQALINAIAMWHANPQTVPSHFVFGDGKTAKRIVSLLRRHIS